MRIEKHLSPAKEFSTINNFIPDEIIHFTKTVQATFPKTYLVGGVVRDFLLNKKTRDIDIATSATPDELTKLLSKIARHRFKINLQNKKFGVINLTLKAINIEITTFRVERYSADNRYPKISFTSSVAQDSLRRDFTVNALYLDISTNKIIDFHNGLKDLRLKKLRFIGDAKIKITEDPIRIIRAFRLQSDLEFKLDGHTKKLLQKNFSLTNNLTKNIFLREIKKIKSKNLQKQLQKLYTISLD